MSERLRELWEEHIAPMASAGIHDRCIGGEIDEEEAAMEEFEGLLNSGGWISVDDRLPEEGERILACDPTKEPQVDLHVCNPDAEVVGHYGRVANVTHWMPLPEPPKEPAEINIDEWTSVDDRLPDLPNGDTGLVEVQVLTKDGKVVDADYWGGYPEQADYSTRHVTEFIALGVDEDDITHWKPKD